MASWSIKNIPDGPWRRFGSKAKLEGKTIKSLFLAWVYEYIKEPESEGKEEDQK